jgi:hypothetical protein
VKGSPARQITEAPTLALDVFADLLVSKNGSLSDESVVEGAKEIAEKILVLEINQILREQSV